MGLPRGADSFEALKHKMVLPNLSDETAFLG